MIIILKPGTTKEETGPIYKVLEEKGIIIQDIVGASTRMIGMAGDTSHIFEDSIMAFPCVERIMRVQESYKLAGRKFHPADTIVEVDGRKIGGGNFAVIAGPCSVESEDQILTIARDVKASGAVFMRGGAFKPRTSPYAFNGLGLDGLELLKIARQKTGLPVVTEIMSPEYLDVFAQDVDIIQIGARNMQNFSLLRQVGELGKPVLLKRGLSATIEELLMAAEYLLVSGSAQIILCERGIRTFETSTRNTLDLSAIPVLKAKTHLPVMIDPSHATGYWHLVEPMALAAVAAGCDGLIIEVHNRPEAALCDGAQSITPQIFQRLMVKIQKVRDVLYPAE
ncbi:MAG: 3-deoxy-7-phosphoheptulonate synthase [Syntrophomonadaceae bacterium]|jgi:3-deoxy-7-phosphoheptulonate synthase|nr:3-deoxy-7-phosphoheptulonate synthase [Syntrophomonadaceae bacterium]